MANDNTTNTGKNKHSSDHIIEDSIAQQQSWMNRRRKFTRDFLKRFNNKPKREETSKKEPTTQPKKQQEQKRSVLREYWFPILCALLVLFVAIWVAFISTSRQQNIIVLTAPTKIVETTSKTTKPVPAQVPTFDIVRIKKDGMIIVAGRWQPKKTISVLVNKKIVATEQTNDAGEFVYAPKNPLKPGNYTLSLLGVNPKMKSQDKVFIYISEAGYKNSISLLITPKGSKILQSPRKIMEGDLAVSKIDYLDNGRIVVTGTALPRLRVSLSLNDKYIGFARVSDYRNFGLGADVGDLKSGEKYKLDVRLHDTDGHTITKTTHEFVMPEMTGDDDTFYTVRRGDCLWIIARNFLRRGILFSIIAERNKIENPDLIFPKQNLQIPTKTK